VTESTKTGLIAFREVLREAGFNYSKCFSLPMAEATSIEFSHIMQQYLTFKPSSSQVDKKQVSRHFRWFFYQGGLPDSSIRRVQQWEGGGGQMAGKGFMKKCQRKVNK